MHRTVINLRGTGESETDEIKQALEGKTEDHQNSPPPNLFFLVLVLVLLLGNVFDEQVNVVVLEAWYDRTGMPYYTYGSTFVCLTRRMLMTGRTP